MPLLVAWLDPDCGKQKLIHLPDGFVPSRSTVMRPKGIKLVAGYLTNVCCLPHVSRQILEQSVGRPPGQTQRLAFLFLSVANGCFVLSQTAEKLGHSAHACNIYSKQRCSLDYIAKADVHVKQVHSIGSTLHSLCCCTACLMFLDLGC